MMQTIPVKEMKKWAKDNLPPMAWQRVTFRILRQLNKMNVFLHYFEDDNYLLKEDVFKTLDNTFLEMFGKQFTDAPAEIIAPFATEKPAFVPTVVPVEEPKVVPIIVPIDDVSKESIKTLEKIAERLQEVFSIEKNEEEISPKLEETKPVKVVEPIIEKVEEILPVVAPIIEKVEEILPVNVPIIEKVEEILPVVEPIVEKVEEILPVNVLIIEKVEEILPVVEPIVKKVEEILPVVELIVEKIEEIALPKEEEKVIEKPAEKPFVPLFSPEQLKRIFGKKD